MYQGSVKSPKSEKTWGLSCISAGYKVAHPEVKEDLGEQVTLWRLGVEAWIWGNMEHRN